MVIFIQDGVITVNDIEYQTISDFVKENKISSINVVSNWVRRGKIQYIKIPQFNNIILVRKQGLKSLDSRGIVPH